MNKSKIIWTLVSIGVIAGLVWLIMTPGKSGKLDAFATCIKDSGARYYGAFWCPNCKNQEALFGRSAKLLPRIECSTPDGKGQLLVCQEASVQGYPTWDFPGSATASSTRETGVLTLDKLAELTSCQLPQTE